MKIKEMLKNCIKVLLLLVAICACMSKPIHADVGYYSSYSSGGGSSSSGSSYSSSSGSSYSSSRSSSSDSGSYSSSDSDDVSLLEVLIIFGVILAIALLTNRFNKKDRNNVNISYTPVLNNTNSVENKIREIDPLFSAENFIAFAKEVFIKIETAWSERKWEGIRPFESNELFEQHSKQLQQLIDANQINVMDRICVREAHLSSFRQDGDKEILVMTLKSAAKDYIIEEKTKKVVQGNPNEDVYMVYTLTFMRKAGVKTKEGTDKKSTTNCPNCGAPTKITSAGKCEYCGSIITTGEHDWVLSDLQGRRGM